MSDLVEKLKDHEGFRERPYQCSEGVWTFGYGFTYLTKDEADIVLRIKVRKLRARLYPWIRELSPERQDVIVNMAFNLGISGLMKFKKMWAAIEVGEWNKAAAEMLDSRWARQVGYRAVELAEVMRGDG